jgi:hypothetical protein
MALFLRKKSTLEEAQAFLQGGLIGGEDLQRKPLYLHNKTIVFAAPFAGTITFQASENGGLILAANPGGVQVPLTIAEVLAQINSGSTNAIRARAIRGHLVLLDGAATPAAAVSITSGTALVDLGFSNVAQVGKFYKPPDSTTPRLLFLEPEAGGVDGYVLGTEE